jgi:hypothetical protein
MQFNSSLVTSLALKTAGLVLILSTVVNVIFASLPYQLGDINWWAFAGAELLSRGFNPMIGIVFLIVGKWIETLAKEAGRGSSKNWFFLSAVTSIVFGLVYLAVIPFQVVVANTDRNKMFDQINQELGQKEDEFKAAFNVLEDKTKSQQQIAAMDQTIKSGQVQGAVLDRLRQEKALYEQLSADPTERKKQFTKGLGAIVEKRQLATNQVNTNLFKTGIRASLFSLLLAAGHLFIGFTGLRHKQ